jgi:hypothetical protein
MIKTMQGTLITFDREYLPIKPAPLPELFYNSKNQPVKNIIQFEESKWNSPLSRD